MAVKVSVTGADELGALVRHLAAAEKTLIPELRRGLRKAAGPAVRDTQEAVRNLPIRGTRGGGLAAREIHQQRRRATARRLHSAGLRATIARLIAAETKLGRDAKVTIRTRSRELPPDQRKLPRYLDWERGWRHPVFGDRKTWLSLRPKELGGRSSAGDRKREVWVQQYGKPWFATTLVKHGPNVRTESLDVMKAITDLIAKG